MRGADAEQNARETGTVEYEKKRTTRKKWLRRLRFWGPALILAIWSRGCLVEVSETTVFGATKARDAIEQTARKLREPPPPGEGGAERTQPLRPSASGNWELYREFDIVLVGDEESLEYSIQADAGERRVPTWRTHGGEVDVFFNGQAGGTDTSERFLTPPTKAANGTEFIQFRARKGGAHITLYVWREK